MDQAGRVHQRRADQGDAEDRARLIVHRLRAGTLSTARVELAAACGHEAALLALGRTAGPVSTPSPVDLQRWLDALPLDAGDTEVRLRVGLAAVRTVHGLEPPGEARQAVEVLAAWVERLEDDVLREQVLRSANRCGDVIRRAALWASAKGVGPGGLDLSHARGPLSAAVLACHCLLPDLLTVAAGDAMRAVVSEELVAWALSDAAPAPRQRTALAVAQRAVWYEAQTGGRTSVMPRDPYPAH